MLGYITSFIGTKHTIYNSWKKDLNKHLSAMKIQSVTRGHLIRRIYSNLLVINKNNKIDTFNSNKTLTFDTNPKNKNLEIIENEIDFFIKNRNKYFN